ncbi:6239_t:CDS:2 [Paraglomus occultum]|uniref:6239_t:CDS:1 n=1 Tax=Paraglomus occultum TaxID=144539 RepID=A0A9N9A7I5_9GLOM|nr:6239_t:CDS:2 [Paraglomus occultum]
MGKFPKNVFSSRSFETVKVGLLLVAQHAPLIGEIATVAGQILDMTQMAHHNKAICKTIHDVVLSNMNFLESLDKEEYGNNKPLEHFLRDVYLPTLVEIATTIAPKKKSTIETVAVYVLSQDDSKALQIASGKLIHIQQHLLVLQGRGHGRMMTKLIEQSDKTIELLSPIVRVLKDAMGICEIQEHAVNLEKLVKIGELQNTMASIPDPSITNALEFRGPSAQSENMRDTIAAVTRNIEIPMKNISDYSREEPFINGKIVRKLYYRQQQVAQKYLGQVNIMDSAERNDINLMIAILKLMDDCENVLKFIGTLQDSGKLYMITQWCENGNLENYLANAPANLDWSIKLKIATGIANGLVFCHDREVLHHDLRSHNVLLDDRLCPKLTGFQLSRFQTASSNNRRPEHLGYFPPEKFADNPQPYRQAGDIYSFGVLLWEIAYQEKPMKDKPPKDIIPIVLAGGRPESSKQIEIIEGYKEIMEEAWSQEPCERPKADEVYGKLLKLSNERAPSSPTVHPSTPRENSVSELPCLDEGVPDIEEIKQLHEDGRYEEAFAKFTKLAEFGNAEAFYYLGLYYQKGLCVEANEAAAMDYYGKAVERGNIESADKYAELSLRRAFKYVEKAASEGHAPCIKKYETMKQLFDQIGDLEAGPNGD